MVCLQNVHIPLASTFSGSLIANQLNTHYSVGSSGSAPATLYRKSIWLAITNKKNKARCDRALFSSVEQIGLTLVFNAQVIKSLQFSQCNRQCCLCFSH